MIASATLYRKANIRNLCFNYAFYGNFITFAPFFNYINMTYNETLNYLYSRLPVFHQIGAAAYKPGLDNTSRLMDALDNPHLKFRTIHIAGTNGKGSVSHMLAAVLQSAGYKTGLYTSPHLIHFGERIRINGNMIDEQYVVDFVKDNKNLLNIIQPSFFEATMAMAFSYFADQDVDIAVVEVGLGGRLDSTNIIYPELSVITNISYDHMKFLGNSLEKIAAEKAGIIKPEVPVVIGEWLPETRPVFEARAAEMNAPLYSPDSPMRFVRYDGHKMICTNTSGKSWRTGLLGEYQLLNVATALKVIEVFNLNHQDKVIPDEAVETGIEFVTEITGLRGRWEVFGTNPLKVADTGHNLAGISFVAGQLKHQTYRKLHFIIGMVNDKDIVHIVEKLPVDASYYFTQANVSRALSASELAAIALSKGLKGEIYNTVSEAYEAACTAAVAEDMIFAGGSNFVVGELLAGL